MEWCVASRKQVTVLRIDPVSEVDADGVGVDGDGGYVMVDEDDGFDVNEPFGGVGE